MNARITALAFQIADSTASADIETLCRPAGGEPQTVEEFRACFFDLEQLADPEDAPAVAMAVEYLEGRRLLKRHPEHANWVRPVHNYDVARAA